MLYWLLYEKLFPFFHPFRIFRYLTFRTAFASGTALLIAMFIGPWVIQKLREFQIGQYVRDDGPQSHLKKTGTPTMGGVLIGIAILLPTVLWSDPANPFVWIVVFSTLAWRRGRAIAPYEFLLGLICAGLAGLRPQALQPVYGPWMKAVGVIGKFNTWLVMGLVYYLVLTPYAVLARLLGGDLLDERIGDRASYWHPRAEAPARESYRDQF